MKYWKIEDVNNGLCTVAEVGTPRPEQIAVVDPTTPAVVDPDAPVPSLREQLSKDALVAYRELGGVEYLKKNPALLDKVLAKSIAPEPIAVHNNVHVLDDMPWLTAQRHAYKLGEDAWKTIETGLSIIDAEIKHDDSALPEAGSARDSADPLLPPPDAE
ncbi:hypothetical protein LJR260_003647 [Variovorax paradoxus]|uniref:hypothetical protein n=1 Tax=Variovorax paradoxus TaxID=34073 RepID=UPI003ED124E9